jgi:uncharacterized flavoprotein (TIGR03862 family)
VVRWCEDLGQPTFVGTSGRIFPKAMKASPLLRAWLRRLAGAGVVFKFRHRWTGWSGDGTLSFESGGASLDVRAEAAISALGGASWPRLGSDGSWAGILGEAAIDVAPLCPANCGFQAAWSNVFRDRFEGQPLKRVALSFGRSQVRGEALIARDGIEGGAVYALSAPLRDAIAADGEAMLRIALRPDFSVGEIESKLAAPRRKQSLATFLRKAIGLSPAAIGLLHEAALAEGRPLAALAPPELAALIDAVPVRLTAAAPVATAISTAGGVRFEELDEHFMLRRRPGIFVAGEMLDWEAPTGGYLLQASFATGIAAGRGALTWLAGRRIDRPAGGTVALLS